MLKAIETWPSLIHLHTSSSLFFSFSFHSIFRAECEKIKLIPSHWTLPSSSKHQVPTNYFCEQRGLPFFHASTHTYSRSYITYKRHGITTYRDTDGSLNSVFAKSFTFFIIPFGWLLRWESSPMSCILRLIREDKTNAVFSLFLKQIKILKRKMDKPFKVKSNKNYCSCESWRNSVSGPTHPTWKRRKGKESWVRQYLNNVIKLIRRWNRRAICSG